MDETSNRYKGLRQFDKMSPEERADCGRRGGIKSGETRRAKKKMKEQLNIILSMPLKNKRCYEVDEIKNFSSMNGKNIDVQTAILIKQVQRALKGDLPSAEFVRDTSGQKPKDNLDISGAVPVVISGEEDLED